MKPSNALLGLAAFTHSINAVATPQRDAVAIDARTPASEFETHPGRSTNEELWKRKGGGGGGGRGGGGGGGGKGGSGTSGGGRGGSTPGRGSSSDNTGGRTTTGTGPPRSYGGGYYSGGASVPYRAGNPVGSIVPGLLVGAAIGGLAFGGLHYLHGAYVYPYRNQYYYHNATTDKNETKPVICVCEPYNPCACDDNGNQTYFKSVIGDGSYQNLNHSIVTIAQNETTNRLTIYINGGLPNGTTAPGGTDEPSAANSMMALAQAAGWWPAATMAFALAFIM